MADYTYWQNALSGTFGAVHDGDPQPGFYRARNKDGIDDPVAIWSTGEAILAVKSGKTVDANDVWTHCCQKPISEAVYRAVAERGEAWPDAIAPIGSNFPPGDEAEADEIQSAIDAALAELKTPINVQADCDRLANHKDRLAKLYQAQEKSRKAEKQPHLDAGKAVDDKFKPILAKIEDAGEKLKKAITGFLLKEEHRRRAEAVAKMQAEEVARKAAIAANQPPPEPAPLPEVERPKAGTAGRAMALRTHKSAVITDYAATLMHFAENSEVRELIQTLANRAIRAGSPVPGCEIHEERTAA